MLQSFSSFEKKILVAEFIVYIFSRIISFNINSLTISVISLSRQLIVVWNKQTRAVPKIGVLLQYREHIPKIRMNNDVTHHRYNNEHRLNKSSVFKCHRPRLHSNIFIDQIVAPLWEIVNKSYFTNQTLAFTDYHLISTYIMYIG